MEAPCSNCGKPLESPRQFCPACGSKKAEAVQAEEVRTVTEPQVAEEAPVKGAFGGLLFGVLAVPILVIVGTMLCLTGLGAILGIPMILAALLAPLMGPMIGLQALKGKCPWCGVSVSSIANARDFHCHNCGRRIAIRRREFVSAH